MIPSLWLSLIFSTLIDAIIIFHKPQPACKLELNGTEKGHLRGQTCLIDDTCAPVLSEPKDDDSWHKRQTSVPRGDGRCGEAFNRAGCDPGGPFGGCCSRYGYCGSSPEHCSPSNGCQSGCSSADPTTTTAQSEPVLGSPTSAPSSSPTGSITTDGTCGAANSNTICGDWHLGGCCSMYGFCGNTTGHCGEGCQSGPCDQPAVSPAPGPSPAPPNPNPGSFRIIGESGVPAMHAALMPNGRVVFLDKVENYTQLTLLNGQYAYSAEYDPVTNRAAPLAYKTNAFCAGGTFLADGTLLSVGGNAPLTWLDPTVGDGFRAVRYLTRSSTDASLTGQSWIEPGNRLDSARWYPSVQTMPDGSIFVASGSLNGLDPSVPSNNNPTYEVLSPQGVSMLGSTPMTLLVLAQPYYMYPFIHLLKDGSLFVFVSKSSEIFDVAGNRTIRTFPDLPGDYRTYLNTGGSVLLPLSSANNWDPEVLICGGGAYQDIISPTDASCGRLRPMQTNAAWEMDSMPEGRGMVEGTLLPDGTVLWVNGCNQGAQGFGLARAPTLEVLIYDPVAPLGKRWTYGASTTIPRLYHSVALLLLDGTLMIAGSNPVEMPVLTPNAANPYSTEFRVEIYTPPYLSGANALRRPGNIRLSSLALKTGPSSTFGITFAAPADARTARVALYHGGFVTHSLHMGHRMIFLEHTRFIAGQQQQSIVVSMPPNTNIAPPGPYVVYVTVDSVPGIGQFVIVS